MAMNWPTFFKRSGSAVVFCIVMLTGLLWNDYAFIDLILLVQFLCIHEYFKLMHRIYPDTPIPMSVKGIVQILGAATLLLSFSVPGIKPSLWPALLFVPVTLFLICALSPKASVNTAFLSFGAMVYIILPMTLLLQLRSISMILPVGLIAMIWVNDTMAYIVGSFIGKTPFSAISPKKTWEGTAGGALLTLIAAGIWGSQTSYYTITDWVALALCAAVAGTLGDLLESKLKRMADVKDSGAIMPGHGGALDRFDSLLVATPFAFSYAYLCMEALPVSIF